MTPDEVETRIRAITDTFVAAAVAAQKTMSESLDRITADVTAAGLLDDADMGRAATRGLFYMQQEIQKAGL